MTGADSLPPHIKAIVEEELRNYPRRVVRMVDYLVVAVDLYDPARVPAGAEGAVELARGVRIERLQPDLAERLFKATTLAGENWSPPGLPDAVHAFVADALVDGELVAGDATRTWDAERLWPAVQLSRLVRDNAISAEHAARLEIFADGSERIVPFGGYENFTVYRLYPERSGWLDVVEAAQLAALLKAFWDGPELPLRVRRALRRVEAVVSERYLEDALPVVVGAFESLLQIGRDYATAQFSQRVPGLAAELGVPLSTDECKDIYNDRSALVHGSGVDLSVPHDLSEFGGRFNRLQETLRLCMRRAIEDRAFAAVFDDETLIAARWPAVVTKRDGTTKTM